MLQDIAPVIFQNAYTLGKTPRPGDTIFCFRDHALLVRREAPGLMTLPRYEKGGEALELIYLFSLDGTDFYLAAEAAAEMFPGFAWEDIRCLRRDGCGPRALMFAAFTACHLADWYRSNRFCGACAQPLLPAVEERAMYCPSCGQRVYPRINPAIVAAVIHGDAIVLTRYARGSGFYALIAGFSEIGETLEDTVRREVREEVGLEVRNLRYYKSQPWGIAGDLMVGFVCEVEGSRQITVDGRELKEARWVRRQEVLLQPDDYSLTNEMMARFREGRL